MSEHIIELIRINKMFPGVQALEDVSFNVRRGDVHALVGENGAGKTTLLKILNGNHRMDSGTILFDGHEADIHSPNKARELGISIISQEFNLIQDLSVAENIYLGRLDLGNRRRLIIDWNAVYESANALLQRIGYQIDSRRLVTTLSVAEKQMVEIAKAFSYRSRVILMDEPSATLTENELENLFRIIRELKSQDVTVMYISHRLEEIFEICGSVTVMRDGRIIDTQRVKDTTREEIIRKMVGREITEAFPKRSAQIGSEVLRVENLATKAKVDNVSLSLCKGEILGIAGLVGAGRTEMARALFGVDYAKVSVISINQKRVRINSPMDAIRNGMAFLTEDRKGEGLIPEFTVRLNATMAILKALVERLLLSSKRERKIVGETIRSLSIRTSSQNQKVLHLSGGNQQKIVLGKWLNTKADIFILDEPTRGIDIGAKQEVYQLMNRIAEEGKSIIFISSELPEILGMSDRVLVMYGGKIRAELKSGEISPENVMRYALWS